MIVIAATPFSPDNFIIILLKKNVVTAAAIWLTISEKPLKQLFARTPKSIMGFRK